MGAHSWNRQCFGVTTAHWAPIAQGNITTGQVKWPPGSAAAQACSAAPTPTPAPPAPPGPCVTALDCGLNGVCNTSTGVCACRPAWKGVHCQTLALLPANLSVGYRHTTPASTAGATPVNTGPGVAAAQALRMSSWGGNVLWSIEDKQWHMFAAEMLNSCGLDAWACNSQVVHATSTSLGQHFSRASTVAFTGSSDSGGGGSSGVLQPRFAHEPVVVRGPGGEWVMFWTGCDPSAAAGSHTGCNPTCLAAADCSAVGDGSTPPSALHDQCGRARSNDHTWMSWAARSVPARCLHSSSR